MRPHDRRAHERIDGNGRPVAPEQHRRDERARDGGSDRSDRNVARENDEQRENGKKLDAGADPAERDEESPDRDGDALAALEREPRTEDMAVYATPGGDRAHERRRQDRGIGRRRVRAAPGDGARSEPLGEIEQKHRRSSGLAQPRLTGQRFECYEKNGYIIINDAYNASPASMAAALTTLSETAPGRRVAVLGDMLELGKIARPAHQRVGQEAAVAGVELLLTRGTLGEEIAKAAKEAGVKEVHICASHEEAGAILRRQLRPGDTVLFKGSHGMRMDKIIDSL